MQLIVFVRKNLYNNSRKQNENINHVLGLFFQK